MLKEDGILAFAIDPIMADTAILDDYTRIYDQGNILYTRELRVYA